MKTEVRFLRLDPWCRIVLHMSGILDEFDVGQAALRELADVQQAEMGAVEQPFDHLHIIASDDLDGREAQVLRRVEEREIGEVGNVLGQTEISPDQSTRLAHRKGLRLEACLSTEEHTS